MRDVLPTLLASQLETNAKRANDPIVDNANKEGQGETDKGDTSGKQSGCTYKVFLDCKPTEFSGADDPVAAMAWLTHTEKMFRTSKCAEGDKVEYATNLLRGAALFWWEMITNTLGLELTRMLTWDQFKVKFCEEFCSDTSVRQLEDEFMHLEQHSKSVQEYTVEFLEKARFAQHHVNTEARKIDRYLWGLKTEIREMVKASRCTTFRQAVEAAKDRETELKRQGKEKNEDRSNF